MKELKNLEAIRELLASHPIYTYDYSDGLYINKEATNIQVYSIDLEDEPFAAYISGYIITYASEEVLFENLRENIISHMDLTKGADDQYFDYNIDEVDMVLYGATIILEQEKYKPLIMEKFQYYKDNFNEEEHAEEIEYYLNFLEKPETLYTFTENTINFFKSLIK